MRPVYFIRMLFLSTLLICAVLVQAQEPRKAHIATEEELYDAVVAQHDSEEADRTAIGDLLRRPEVRTIARNYGLDLTKANERVAILSGAELSRLALQANQLNESIAGGDLGDIELALVIVLAIVTTVIVVLQAYSPS